MQPGPRKLDVSRIAAVILDVDGTMYDQAIVRRQMLGRIVRAHLLRPLDFVRVARVIRAYRHAQEELRGCVESDGGDLAHRQHRRAAETAGVDEAVVRAITNRWMEAEACGPVASAVRPGLHVFLEAARSRGWRLGVVSDYPVAAKLEAMNVARFFDAVVCAQDSDVQRFKPDPRGIEVALSRLGVTRAQAVFVGDRDDVDAEAAARAGVAFVLVGRPAGSGAPCRFVRGFEELEHVLVA